MENEPYIVYAKTDNVNRVIAVNSSAFLRDVEGWTKIDSGHGDRFHHAQGNFFAKPIMDERGVYRYKLTDSGIVERTAEEMEADYTEPETKPTTDERLARLENLFSLIAEKLGVSLE